jgi:hypothetical protein
MCLLLNYTHMVGSSTITREHTAKRIDRTIYPVMATLRGVLRFGAMLHQGRLSRASYAASKLYGIVAQPHSQCGLYSLSRKLLVLGDLSRHSPGILVVLGKAFLVSSLAPC